MTALVFAIIFNSSFTICVRFAQNRGANLTIVGAINYMTAFLLYACIALAGGLCLPHWQTLAIGGVGGMSFSCGYFLLQALMKHRGVSITAAILGLSVLVPVGVSFLAWGESATLLQAVGIVAAIASLPLLSIRGKPPGRTAEPEPAVHRRYSWVFLPGLFLVNGFSLLAARAFHQTGIHGEDIVFLLVIFTSATFTTLLVWAFQENRRRASAGRGDSSQTRSDFLLWSVLAGMAVGMCNALANRLIIVSLDGLPGIIIYPVYSAASLLLTIVFSRLAWKEKTSLFERTGMAFALVSIVLVNLA